MDKEAIRQVIWDRLEAEGLARFPFPPHGRIPNFVGASEAATHLAELSWWQDADRLKCNPDAPQRPVRERALSDGKTVVMPQPRLESDRPFILIEPAQLNEPGDGATIGGAAEHGIPVAPEDVPPIDGIIAGSVAVDRNGHRIGKGEGYSDLEFAILLELGAIDWEVPVATTVHDRQIIDRQLPSETHDVPLDVVGTPTGTLLIEDRPARPAGLDGTKLDAARREMIPVLDGLLDLE